MGDVLKIKQELIKILDERVLICDGAMGTTLQNLGYTITPDLLTTTVGRPPAVAVAMEVTTRWNLGFEVSIPANSAI